MTTPGPYRDRDPRREALIELLAAANGFRLPIREFQRMAVAQIYSHEIEAILAGGWEPTGVQPKLDAALRAWTDLTAEVDAMVTRGRALADEWESHGFGTRSGKYYAETLRELLAGEKKEGGR